MESCGMVDGLLDLLIDSLCSLYQCETRMKRECLSSGTIGYSTKRLVRFVIGVLCWHIWLGRNPWIHTGGIFNKTYGNKVKTQYRTELN